MGGQFLEISSFIFSIRRPTYCQSGSLVFALNCDIKKARIQNGTRKMERSDVENLVVHLEHSLDLSTMESGVKLVGAALTRKSLNKWGVRNILCSAWKDLGVLEIKWVHDNTYIITAQDEITALKILNQVPWAVMKQNFSVKRWSPDLAIEDIQMALVPFWIQIRGVPLSLSTELNVRRLAKEIGEFVEMEDPAKARGFLRVKVVVDFEKPLVPGCWIPRDNNRDTWIEFRYERLQDFCYCCGRI
ncbi:uncharacterized protein At4g02000-like [Malus domestica]|uniref:uncharacterized protein At4g02000-like n=1 Tax=Malus domestica TaxID=3750 RepID=UPI0039766595